MSEAGFSYVILAFLGFGAIIVFLSFQYEKNRTQKFKEIADQVRLSFEEKGDGWISGLENQFPLFSRGRSKRIRNVLRGKTKNAEISIFDYRYVTGGGRNSSTHKQSVILLQSEGMELPAFAMRPENIFHKIGSTLGFQDIDFPNHPTFSNKYLLQGQDEHLIRDLFSRELLKFLEKGTPICLQGCGNRLLYFRHRKRIKPNELKEFLEGGMEILSRLQNASGV
ncbi:MAG: hypothetical protein DWQ01_02450 [Planctomycetota bacterium]|nr:MAG: hypothetical protein DWQ01_02450 [Planctomycetota bacterium]